MIPICLSVNCFNICTLKSQFHTDFTVYAFQMSHMPSLHVTQRFLCNSATLSQILYESCFLAWLCLKIFSISIFHILLNVLFFDFDILSKNSKKRTNFDLLSNLVLNNFAKLYTFFPTSLAILVWASYTWMQFFFTIKLQKNCIVTLTFSSFCKRLPLFVGFK